jgi:hypothetical protein
MSKVVIVNIILILGLGAAGYATYQRINETAVATQRFVDTERLRADYLEQIPFLRAVPDEHAYQEQLRPFFREYFSQVDELVKRHGLNSDFDDYLISLKRREQAKGGAETAAAIPDLVAGRFLYEEARKVFGPLRDGAYAPALTASDHGMRLDVLPAEVQDEPGGKIVFPVVLWGAQTELREDHATHTQKRVALVGFDAVWKLRDAAGKQVGEMRMADPAARLDYPERYIPFFPPQVVLGQYRIDRVPANVETMELAIDVTTRSSWGSSQPVSFHMKMPVKREWKLAPGEVWEGAEVTERPSEEINPPKPAPASAKK